MLFSGFDGLVKLARIAVGNDGYDGYDAEGIGVRGQGSRMSYPRSLSAAR